MRPEGGHHHAARARKWPLGAGAGVGRSGRGSGGGGLGSLSVRQFHSTRPAEKRDFYEVLGLGRGADKSEVRGQRGESEKRGEGGGGQEGREKARNRRGRGRVCFQRSRTEINMWGKTETLRERDRERRTKDVGTTVERPSLSLAFVLVPSSSPRSKLFRFCRALCLQQCNNVR